MSYLVILIRSYRDEGCLVKHVSAVGSVLGSEHVIFVGLDDVKSRLVLVHRVQDDLQKSKRVHKSTSLRILEPFSPLNIQCHKINTCEI